VCYTRLYNFSGWNLQSVAHLPLRRVPVYPHSDIKQPWSSAFSSSDLPWSFSSGMPRSHLHDPQRQATGTLSTDEPIKMRSHLAPPPRGLHDTASRRKEKARSFAFRLKNARIHADGRWRLPRSVALAALSPGIFTGPHALGSSSTERSWPLQVSNP
jgi:hypothetical protein